MDDVVGDLRRKLVELSEGALGFEQIDPTASILDYGYVDSLSAARLLQFIEKRYGVLVPQTELVKTWMLVMFSWFPAAFFALSFLALLRFDFTRDDLDDAQRRIGRA